MEIMAKLLTRSNVKLVFKGDQAGTDGKTIFVPDPALLRQLSSEMEVRRFLMAQRGFVAHESGHVMFTEFGVMEQARTTGGEVKAKLLNALEDIRMEKAISDRYIGVRESIDFLRHKYMWPDIAEKFSSQEKPDILSQILLTLQCLAVSPDKYEDIPLYQAVHPSVREYCEQFREDCAEVLPLSKHAEGTAETYVITERIWDKLKQDHEEAVQEEERKAQQQGNSEGNEGEAQGDQSSGGSGDGESEGQQGGSRQGQSDEDGTEGQTGGEGQSNGFGGQRDLRAAMNLEDSPNTSTEVQSYIKKDAETLAEQLVLARDAGLDTAYLPAFPEDDVYVHPKIRKAGSQAAELKRLREETNAMSGTVKRKLKAMLRAQSRSRRVYDREEGDLDVEALHKLAIVRRQPNVPPRLFSQLREQTDLKNTCVGLMMDTSGSMAGSKAQLAQYAVLAFGDCLDSVDIPFGLWSFTTARYQHYMHRLSDTYDERMQALYSRFYPIEIYTAKTFSERWQHAALRVPGICRGYQYNVDGEAVEYAVKQLLQQKHRRKVLFVFSDGWPASGESYEIERRQRQHLLDVVANAKRVGVELVGVGIQSDAVHAYYDKAVVVTELSKLPKAVMDQMKDLLLKKRRN